MYPQLPLIDMLVFAHLCKLSSIYSLALSSYSTHRMYTSHYNHRLLVTEFTVPIYNSCTKCVDSPGKIHDRLHAAPPSFLGIDAWMTSKLNVALISQVTWVIYVLGLFWHVIHWYLYNQALADVRSTYAVINCLYCTISWWV